MKTYKKDKRNREITFILMNQIKKLSTLKKWKKEMRISTTESKDTKPSKPPKNKVTPRKQINKLKKSENNNLMMHTDIIRKVKTRS